MGESVPSPSSPSPPLPSLQPQSLGRTQLGVLTGASWWIAQFLLSQGGLRFGVAWLLLVLGFFGAQGFLARWDRGGALRQRGSSLTLLNLECALVVLSLLQGPLVSQGFLILTLLIWFLSVMVLNYPPRVPSQYWVPFIREIVSLALVLTCVIVGVSMVFPELSQKFFQSSSGGVGLTGGGSASLRPGQLAALQESIEVAFHVKGDLREFGSAALYWRGMALRETQDGMTWRGHASQDPVRLPLPAAKLQVGATPNATPRPATTPYYRLPEGGGRGGGGEEGSILQTLLLPLSASMSLYALDPPDFRTFAALDPPTPRPPARVALRMDASGREASFDAWGEQDALQPSALSYFFAQPRSQLMSYQVRSHRVVSRSSLTPEARAAALSVPPALAAGEVFAQVARFKQQLGAQADASQRVEVILRWFKREFHQTLEPGVLSSGSAPLNEFLFHSKQGYCEHFAAAFVSLMRLLEVPAQVVVGYRGGEQNRWNQAWVVRARDAHAWAEIWDQPQGRWLRVDPAAVVPPTSPSSSPFWGGLWFQQAWEHSVAARALKSASELVDALQTEIAWTKADKTQSTWLRQGQAFLTSFLVSPSAWLVGGGWTFGLRVIMVFFLGCALLEISIRRKKKLRNDTSSRSRGGEGDGGQRQAARLVATFAQYSQQLQARGLTRLPAESVLAFQARCVLRYPWLAEHAASVSQNYLRLKYSQEVEGASRSRPRQDVWEDFERLARRDLRWVRWQSGGRWLFRLFFPVTVAALVCLLRGSIY